VLYFDAAMKITIVNRVRERRSARGLTQEELAALAGVSRQSIIAIERGRYVPSLPLALRLAEIFGCPTDELFRREEAT
jgi:putative transcriptional regulator